MRFPPDLRREPPREVYSDKKGHLPAVWCKNILTKRHETDLDSLNKKDWQLLREFHETHPDAHKIPDLPLKFKITGGSNTEPWLPTGKTHSMTLMGSPQPLLPILKSLQRFDRPLITWDPWTEEPPPHFQDSVTVVQSTSCNQEDRPGDSLRDPRAANHVTHDNHSQAQYEREQKAMSDEDWIEQVPMRLEEAPQKGMVYVVRVAESDGQYFLGFVMDLGPGDEDEQRHVDWFYRSGKRHTWGKTVKLTLKSESKKDSIEVEAFLLQVDKGHTSISKDNKFPCVSFTVNSDYMRRLDMFAKREGLTNTPSPPAQKAEKPRSDVSRGRGGISKNKSDASRGGRVASKNKR